MTRRWPSRGAVCHCGITLLGRGHKLHIIILTVQDYLNSGWGWCRKGGQNDVAFAVGGLAALRHQGGDDHLDLVVLDVGWELVLDASQAADLCCRPAQKRNWVKDRLCLQFGENGGWMKRTRLSSCSCPSPPPPPPPPRPNSDMVSTQPLCWLSSNIQRDCKRFKHMFKH